jgi:hypothetical protein
MGGDGDLKQRRFAVSPATGLALLALFFALGGSAFAVGERVTAKMQERCAPGAIRGIAHVTGDPRTGLANIPDQFASTPGLFGRRFNCSGVAEVRQLGIGRYEVRFPGVSSNTALVSGIGGSFASATRVGPGVFRVHTYPAGIQSEEDLPFVIVVI